MPTLFDNLVRGELAARFSCAQVVELTFNERQRNRLALMLPNGQAAAIVLPRGHFMQAGDVLRSSDGSALRIEAAVEPLIQIDADNGLVLMRLVYHLANRHVRAMICDHAVFIEPDVVLEQMVRQLGGRVKSVELVFEPEAGAYAGGHHHHYGDEQSEDRAMGKIGEMLSIAAHQIRGDDANR